MILWKKIKLNIEMQRKLDEHLSRQEKKGNYWTVIRSYRMKKEPVMIYSQRWERVLLIGAGKVKRLFWNGQNWKQSKKVVPIAKAKLWY